MTKFLFIQLITIAWKKNIIANFRRTWNEMIKVKLYLWKKEEDLRVRLKLACIPEEILIFHLWTVLLVILTLKIVPKYQWLHRAMMHRISPKNLRLIRVLITCYKWEIRGRLVKPMVKIRDLRLRWIIGVVTWQMISCRQRRSLRELVRRLGSCKLKLRGRSSYCRLRIIRI